MALGGHVNSYAEKLAAVAAARRVKGVHAIADNIEAHCSYEKQTGLGGDRRKPLDLAPVETVDEPMQFVRDARAATAHRGKRPR